MSRSGRVDVAVRLEGSGGADPGVVELVVDVWSPGNPGGEVPDAQLGRNFLFLAKISIFFLRGKWGRKGQEGDSIDGTHLGIFPDSCADMMDYFFFRSKNMVGGGRRDFILAIGISATIY